MAVRNSNLPSLIDVAHDDPVVLAAAAYINGRRYERGEIVGIYDASGDQFFTPTGPVLSAREMRMQIGMVLHDPRHVMRMQAEAEAARQKAEVRDVLKEMRASHTALMTEIASPERRPFTWPAWLVWLFTRPAPLPVLAPRRTSVITRHGFGGAGARA